MRELKFRAFIHPWCGGGIPQECYNTMDYSDNYGGDLGEFFNLYPHFFEVMQYTGLKDKCGKEIYEGDVLDAADRIVKVVWHKYAGQWDTDFIKYQGERQSNGLLNTEWEFRVKVIGNIYENPELL